MADSEMPFVDQVERRVFAHLEPLLEGDEDDIDLIAVVEDAYAAADGVAEFALEQSDAHEQPVCAEGCSYCCYAPLDVSWAEAVTIAAHLYAQVPTDGIQSLMEALAEHEEAAAGLDSPERFAKSLPCPMLDQDSGRCSVYSLRPLRCRGANSLDVEHCKRSCRDRDAEIDLNGLVYEAHLGAWRALQRVCHALDLPTDPVSFSRALRTALDACSSALQDECSGGD
jgi:Fe-S-cluster containining protein